ncbi:nuclear transport factor 2 family protein [Erwinia sp. HR93]|uniref:nuclear transport factor 2 family protein n=1 Tax=Erwinia sp. HR93 TaxID=3094840 RepID=UPI002ADEFC02|nr:nuclear transport factor 2 family protein [Erwinia sp. HR93]MEA1064993.1 nuclear transport factor 2 family protein [Erwinia sp. HR93]
MSCEIDYFPELTAVVHQAIGSYLNADNDTLMSMMTEDILFELPYALPDGPSHISGKAALGDYLPKIAQLISIASMSLENAVVGEGGQQAVLEISCQGTGIATGRRYDQHYVCVLTLRNGFIKRWRDYWNPLVMLQAVGGAGDISQIMKGVKDD